MTERHFTSYSYSKICIAFMLAIFAFSLVILANSQVVSAQGSCAAAYADGSTYATGDQVSHNGNNFTCTQGGWCTIGGLHYEPSVGLAFEQAWTDDGACSGSGGGTNPPAATAVPAPTTVPGGTNPPATGGGGTDGAIKIYYFVEWGVYGRDYHVGDIAPLVQAGHVNVIQYSFINVDSSGNCQLYDTWAADERPGTVAPYTQVGNLRQLAALRDDNAGDLKVVLSLGGWTLSDDFSEVVADSGKLSTMVSSCVAMMQEYDFDGLDIDWEYPGGGGLCGTCGDPVNDKANYETMIMELRAGLDAAEATDNREYLLTAATAVGEDKFHQLPMQAMGEYMDYISVMTYDMNGSWQTLTAHNAPLYGNSNDPRTGDAAAQSENYNIDYALNMYINGGTNKNGDMVEGGIPPEKLVMGLPFYGRSWANVPSTEVIAGLPGLFIDGDSGANVGTSAPDYANMSNPMWDGSTSPGTQADTTGNASGGSWEESVWDYDDIVDTLLTTGGYTRYWDAEAMVPYAYNPTADGGTMISYDDTESIEIKSEYVANNCLGGIMVWELSGNDQNTELHDAVASGLGSYDPANCNVQPTPTPDPAATATPQPTAVPTTPAQPTAVPTTAPPTGGGADEAIKIYYFVEWGVYGRDYHVGDIAPLVQAGHVNVIQYSFINVDASGNCQLYDSWAADERPGTVAPYTEVGNLRQLAALRDDYQDDLKIVLSLGGWTLSQNFSDVVADSAKLNTMVTSCIAMMQEYDFDGLDIDWEYPGGGGLGGNSFDPVNDKANYATMVNELRAGLDAAEATDNRDYLLTAATATGEDKFHHLPMQVMGEKMDYVSVMTYDMNGSWQNMTAHNAPLYANPNDPRTGDSAALSENYNVDYALNMYINGGTTKSGETVEGGIPAHKLVMGLPFYGRSWSNVPSTEMVSGLPGLFADGDSGANVGTVAPDYANMSNPMWDGSTSPGTQADTTGNASGGSWEESVWDYDDIVDTLLTTGGYTRYWDADAMVPYAYNPTADGGTLISYDDTESIQIKSEYVANNCLGGIMVWELSGNDQNTELHDAIATSLGSYDPSSCTPTTNPNDTGNNTPLAVSVNSNMVQTDSLLPLLIVSVMIVTGMVVGRVAFGRE